MKSKFRYVAVHPERIEERKKLGPASYLHDFLVDHQTDAAGNVYYGKALSYAWIRSRWKEAPPVRTLQRHMARLKESGLARVTKLPFGDGMRVRLVRSAKWAPEAAQIPLFPAAGILSINRGKDVKKLSNSAALIPPKVAAQHRQKWRHKEVKKLREETTNCEELAAARSSPVQNAVALDERRRVLADQSRMIYQKYKSSG